MTKEETMPGDALIAKFMGFDVPDSFNLYQLPKEFPCIGIRPTWTDLRFHYSWDWLKPVIDRIIAINGYKMIDQCTDEEWIRSCNVSRMSIGTSIEQAWIYCCEFIEWYNKQNKNNDNSKTQ